MTGIVQHRLKRMLARRPFDPCLGRPAPKMKMKTDWAYAAAFHPVTHGCSSISKHGVDHIN